MTRQRHACQSKYQHQSSCVLQGAVRATQATCEPIEAEKRHVPMDQKASFALLSPQAQRTAKREYYLKACQ